MLLRPVLYASCLTAMLFAQHALAADVLPAPALDGRATSSVSSAETAGRDEVYTSLQFRGASNVANAHAFDPANGSDVVLRDANRISAFAGSALSSSAELSLGLHGTYEHMKPEARSTLFPEQNDNGTGAEWQDHSKQTAFSGATLALKYQLLNSQGFKLSLLPFVETGAGQNAAFALTRSVSPKAGFAGLMTYGGHGVGEVSLNAGYRYRDTEQVAGLYLRNEIFYRAIVKANLSRDFALFVAGDGRRLQTAQEAKRDLETNKLAFAGQESGEVTAGFDAKFGDAVVQAFGGTHVKAAHGIGAGAKVFGVSLALDLGGERRSRRTSVASEIEQEQDEKVAASGKGKGKSKVVTAAEPENDYSEMNTENLDHIKELGADSNDDFKDVDKILAENAKNANVESDDAKVERELKELREAEAKAKADQDAQDKKDLVQKRKEARKQAKIDDAKMKGWMEEANKEVEGMEGITEDEMGWNGLED